MSGSRDMEKEEKNQADFFLQWRNRKRLRCVKVKENEILEKSDAAIRRKNTSRINRRVVRADKETPFLHPNRLNRNNEEAMVRCSGGEKEDRYYSRRGFMEGGDEGGFVWPKFYVSLSSKEKEEDFMAMKGCKLPQRPKKRAKFIQRSIHLVSPGTWLCDLSQERYEVREKNNSKKRTRGLKAMGKSDSE